MSSVSSPFYDALKPSAPVLEEGADSGKFIEKVRKISERIAPIREQLTAIHESWAFYKFNNAFTLHAKEQQSAKAYEELKALESTKDPLEKDLRLLEQQFMDFDRVQRVIPSDQAKAFTTELNSIRSQLKIYNEVTFLKKVVCKTLPRGYGCVIS